MSTGSDRCSGSEFDGQVGGGVEGGADKGWKEVAGGMMKRGDCEGCEKGDGKGMGRRGTGGGAQLEGPPQVPLARSFPPLPPLPSHHTFLIGSKAHERRVNGRLFHMAPDSANHQHLSHAPLSLCRLHHAKHPTTLPSAAPPGPAHGGGVCPGGAEMLVAGSNAGSNWTKYGPGATLRWNFLKGRVLATDAPVDDDALVARLKRGSTLAGRVARLLHSSANVLVYALSNWCGAVSSVGVWRQTEECGRLVGTGGHVSFGGAGGGVWAVGSWVDNVPVLVAAALCLVLLVVVCVCVCVCVCG